MLLDHLGRAHVQLSVHQSLHPAAHAAVRQAQHIRGNPSAASLIPWWTKARRGSIDGGECRVGQAGSVLDNPLREEVWQVGKWGSPGDVGATGVFDPSSTRGAGVQGSGDGSFVDIGSHSRSDIFGRAVDGPHASRRLSPIDHVDTFWFAWAAHLPGTSIVRARAAP